MYNPHPRLTLSAAQVRAFWDRMSAHYRTQTVAKAEALEMRLCGRALSLIGVMPYEDFMDRYTTVWWRRVYPCFTPGQGDAEERWKHVVICTHEHQHVEQFCREGFAAYSARYLLSSRQRAIYEAEAYCCNLELAWRSGRPMPDIDRLADLLAEYQCAPADIAAARQIYAEAADRIRQGHVLTEATATALEILRTL